MTNYLIAGATGGVGQLIVRELRENNEFIRILARSVQKAQDLLGEDLDIIEGDVTISESLSPTMNDISIIICAIGSRPTEGLMPEQIDYDGVRNLVDAAVSMEVPRFILVSSCRVTHPENPLNQFGRVLDWKLKGEDYLRESGLQYTIVRPGGLTNELGGQHGIKIDQGDKISGMISRENVARILIHAANSTFTMNKTFEVIETMGTMPKNWDNLFKKLK
jgi:uncharacterized protein YbjT (DUF2867 family)